MVHRRIWLGAGGGYDLLFYYGMIISLIVAASENDVIGKQNALPWSLPEDLKYFREKTRGKTVIMGRKTYESIGKPLPNRRNIVISRTMNLMSGLEVHPALGEALMKLAFELKEAPQEEVFVIGGADIFNQTLLGAFITYPADKIYLTRIHANIEGDVRLPAIDWAAWRLVSAIRHEADAEHAYPFTFEVYERKK